MAIIGVGIYSIEAGGYIMLEICIITVIVKGRVLLEIPSMHKLVQYFQTLHTNEDICELKVYILPPLNLIFSQAMLNIVVYQMLVVTNVPVSSAAL